MTVPPSPQGPWQSGPPGPRQPPTWPPGRSPQGQPYGPPPRPYPGWPPHGPPKKSNALKWALVAVTLIAVVAVAVVLTLIFSRGGAGGSPSDGGGSHLASGIASANDAGPVAVITDEPTCDKFGPINDGLANQARNGWDKRDPSIPATDWTADQRTQYQAVGTIMRTTADQFVPLAKQTPHRVVREIYEQFIVYAQAYADRIATYTAPDNYLALVAVGASSAVYDICHAISQGSASAWGPSVPPVALHAHSAAPGNPANPQRLITSQDPVCDDLVAATNRYVSDTSAWETVDARIPATQWDPDQRAIFDAVKPVMSTYADNIERLGKSNSNSVVQDLTALSAQYLRAYVQGLSTYVPSDSFLAAAAHDTKSIVVGACIVVGS